MPNQADKWTDKELERLEKKIREVYAEASRGMTAEVNKYFKGFNERDEKMRERLDAGDITPDYYKQWRLNQMGRGERLEAMANRLATNLTNSNEIANKYINGTLPAVYATNRNFGAYEIESVGHNIGFTLFDESTVKRLIQDDPAVMPSYPTYREIEREIDVAYGKKQIKNAITSGILQGKSISGIKDDLIFKIPGMGQSSAIRAARTAVTSAQNGGRQDSYNRAEEMGIEIQKEWMATLDERTREEHRLLDGQRVGIHDKFSAGGYRLRFPGDPMAVPSMVYNCRCTMVSFLPEIAEDQERMTYSEWMEQKQEEKVVVEPEMAEETPKELVYSEKFNEFAEYIDKNYKIDKIEVEELDRELTEDEIIEKLAGGDLTGGSCNSLALAYIGNKIGYDVTDYRGGDSQEAFSHLWKKIFEFDGIKDAVTVEEVKKQAADTAKALKLLPKDKEFYLEVGSHAAIVKNTENGPFYLELQSATESGWTAFARTVDYGWYSEKRSVADTLNKRFKAKKTATKVMGYTLPSSYTLIDVEKVTKSDDLKAMFEYMNTQTDKQKKGKHGTTK